MASVCSLRRSSGSEAWQGRSICRSPPFNLCFLDESNRSATPMLKRMPWPVILQVIPELSAGGAERSTIEMAEAITLAGGRALVVSAGGRLEDELVAAGGELVRLSAKTKNPAAILFNAWRIAQLIGDRGISLVHARSRAPAWSAYLAARRTRRCFVTTYHGIYNQKTKLKAFYNGVMARGDTIICNSQYTARLVRERYPEAAERVGVIYRGVDLKAFDPAAVSAERVRGVREQWGVALAKRIVLLPARLTRWKGQMVLIEAAAKLFAQGEYGDIAFVLTGDEQTRSAFKAEIQASIEAHGLTGRVFVPGHCGDMPAAFKAASFTVLPSIEAEAFGRSAVEAQAMGCPVIASNTGAFPETVTREPGLLAHAGGGQGGSGGSTACTSGPGPWLFEPGNAVALCDSLRHALGMDAGALEALRQRGIERVRREFSTHSLQLQSLTVYDRLLGTQLAEAFKTATQK
jgi:glycosyltransferase involved in cell wall biosynthesis